MLLKVSQRQQSVSLTHQQSLETNESFSRWQDQISIHTQTKKLDYQNVRIKWQWKFIDVIHLCQKFKFTHKRILIIFSHFVGGLTKSRGQCYQVKRYINIIF